MWKGILLIIGTLALIACAHRGGLVFPSPTLDPSAPTLQPPVVRTHQDSTAVPNSIAPIGGAIIDPDPSELGIRAAPTEHHAVDLVTKRSAVITASPGGVPVTVHNNGQLLGRDGCAGVDLAPEGDTRLTVILPESGEEFRSRFYLVGCSAGNATLTIVSEGELLNVYEFRVLPPQ